MLHTITWPGEIRVASSRETPLAAQERIAKATALFCEYDTPTALWDKGPVTVDLAATWVVAPLNCYERGGGDSTPLTQALYSEGTLGARGARVLANLLIAESLEDLLAVKMVEALGVLDRLLVVGEDVGGLIALVELMERRSEEAGRWEACMSGVTAVCEMTERYQNDRSTLALITKFVEQSAQTSPVGTWNSLLRRYSQVERTVLAAGR